MEFWGVLERFGLVFFLWFGDISGDLGGFFWGFWRVLGGKTAKRGLLGADNGIDNGADNGIDNGDPYRESITGVDSGDR